MSINETTGIFYTMQREADTLNIRTRRFDGNEIRSQTIPLLSKSYFDDIFTSSTDGRTLVYFDQHDNRSIKAFNMDNGTTAILLSQVSNYGLSIKSLEYVSDNEIIFALYKDEEVGRSDWQIIKYNLQLKSASVISRPINILHYKHAYSSDKTRLAYVEGGDKTIIIVNLMTGENTKVIVPYNIIISSLCWSPDGKTIGYADGDSIKILDVATKKITAVKIFPEDFICYALKFTDNDHLIYYLGKGGVVEPLQMIEIATGKRIKNLRAINLNGRFFVVDDGKKIIAEVGH